LSQTPGIIVPEVLGFSSDSSSFVYCSQNAYIDFKTCEVIETKTGTTRREMASIDGFQWNKDADAALEKTLNALDIKNKSTGQWPFTDLLFHWQLEYNKSGESILNVWAVHADSEQRLKIDSNTAAEFSGNNLLGVFVAPSTKYVAIAYHVKEVEDVDRIYVHTYELHPLVSTVYGIAGDYYFTNQQWNASFQSYERQFALDATNSKAALSAARAAARLQNEKKVRYYLSRYLQSAPSAAKDKISNDDFFTDYFQSEWFKNLLNRE
jgi:hypothetical protein